MRCGDGVFDRVGMNKGCDSSLLASAQSELSTGKDKSAQVWCTSQITLLGQRGEEDESREERGVCRAKTSEKNKETHWTLFHTDEVCVLMYLGPFVEVQEYFFPPSARNYYCRINKINKQIRKYKRGSFLRNFNDVMTIVSVDYEMCHTIPTVCKHPMGFQLLQNVEAWVLMLSFTTDLEFLIVIPQ